MKKFIIHYESLEMNHIYKNVFLGSFIDSNDKSQLVKNNIKFIFNVAKECNNNNQILNDLKIGQTKFEIYDDYDITLEKLEKVNNFISNNKDINFLIHCHHGRSRSVCFVIYYLMKNNFTLKDAIDFTKNKRSIITPSLNYIKLLSNFDKTYNINKKYLEIVNNLLKNDYSDDKLVDIFKKFDYDINKIINYLLI